MNDTPQIAWHGRYWEVQKALLKVQADTKKELEAVEARAARKVAHMKARKDSAETRVANKFLKERAALMKRFTAQDRVLRRAIAVIEDCCLPSPHVKDAREQILDALRLYKELK